MVLRDSLDVILRWLLNIQWERLSHWCFSPLKHLKQALAKRDKWKIANLGYYMWREMLKPAWIKTTVGVDMFSWLSTASPRLLRRLMFVSTTCFSYQLICVPLCISHSRRGYGGFLPLANNRMRATRTVRACFCNLQFIFSSPESPTTPFPLFCFSRSCRPIGTNTTLVFQSLAATLTVRLTRCNYGFLSGIRCL